MINVTILGPNLPPNAGDETFHVHATGCQDIARSPLYRAVRHQRGPAWTLFAATYDEVAAAIYCDMIPDEMTVYEALGDIRFFPCTGL